MNSTLISIYHFLFLMLVFNYF